MDQISYGIRPRGVTVMGGDTLFGTRWAVPAGVALGTLLVLLLIPLSALLLSSSPDVISDLHPALAYRLGQTVSEWYREGIDVRIVSGYRSWEDQDALFAQGRDTPGKIVTRAKAGQSWHNFGLAADIQVRPAGEAAWRSPTSTEAAVAEGFGLEWGGRWKYFCDPPHFQFTQGRTLSAERERVSEEEGESQ